MRMPTLVLMVLALSAFIGCQSKPMAGSDGQSAGEGIKVRGDWVIELRNPDGDLETRREFSNYWVGHIPLAVWLSEDVKVDARYLMFPLEPLDYSGTQFPLDPVGCEVDQSRPEGHPNEILFLEASAMRMGDGPNNTGMLTKSVWTGSCKIDLGTWHPEQPKTIEYVQTQLSFDTDLETAGPGYGDSAIRPEGETFTLSEKGFSPHLEIVNGQAIAVTVTLSSGDY